MITGLGVDIVEIDRMAAALERHPRMRERLFSKAERDYCEGRNRPEIHYALRFAAKEAVLKALGTGFSGMKFTDVEVLRDAGGRPTPQLSGRAAEVAEEIGVRELHLSLSYTHTTAVASAVAITREPEPDAGREALKRRSAAFRDARSLVEDLDRSAP
jgi:holo-[acyl-carrier protein] synthase